MRVDEFRQLPYLKLGELMEETIIIDGRNALNIQELKDAGYRYIGVGRG